MTLVFIDRDGVINRNRNDYVKTVDEFVFLPGALEGLARLKSAGHTVVVISNQAGVGRGLIEPTELERINQRMLDGVTQAGGEVSAVYYCVHRKDEGCACRKPEPGLFIKAGRDLGLALEGSYLIGDAETDIAAGHRAGCTTILVLTGKSSADDAVDWDLKPDHIADDLPSAVEWILDRS